MLSLAPKPDTSRQWQVHQQILAEMQNEMDIFQLVESGNMLDEIVRVVDDKISASDQKEDSELDEY